MFFKLENESVFIICAKKDIFMGSLNLSEVTLFIEKKARTEIENSCKN